MKDNFSNIGQAFKHSGQAPLDGKYLIEDIAELDVSSPNQGRAYTFYEGCLCYVAPKKGFYVWTDDFNPEEIAENPDLGIIQSQFTYPEDTVYGEIDYSEKTYMFIRLNINFGSNSDAENVDIGDLISLYINLSPEKAEDVLNPTDEDLHNALSSLLDYIRFYFKRNNLLHFVDNLFAFTTNSATRKELDDKYRSNSMYYVLGNHITVDDVDEPTKITIQSRKSQGTITDIAFNSHNGFMHLLARDIYNIIKNDGVGYIDIQSHDGHFLCFKFTAENVLFVKGDPFSSLGPEAYDMANFISITGVLDSKYGTLINKPTKVRVRSVFGRNNNLNVPGTSIPIKESIIGFTRKQVVDNSFIMTHNLNVDRYISEVFSYPQSIYTEQVPTTLNPRELQEARIISNYGPNDANTIYLRDIVAYKDETEDETIFYLVKYIEKTDYELVMPYELLKICQLNNDPEETLNVFKIIRAEVSAGFYSPYDGTGDFAIKNLHVIDVEESDPNYPDEVVKFNGVEIENEDIILYEDINDDTGNFNISVKASGGNRPVKRITFQIEDFQGRFSNPFDLQIIKQGFDADNNHRPIINPIPILNTFGDILVEWDGIVRLTSLGQYFMQAIPYDADSNYPNPESPGELEVRFQIIRNIDNFVVLDETISGNRSEEIIMIGFFFPEPDVPLAQIPNTTRVFRFLFTVTDPQGATTTTERKITVIY